MKETEFDKFADEYRQLHSLNIKASGEGPDFFAEYKVSDTANILFKSNKREKLRILDFGSGVGNSIQYFKQYFPNCELTCLDVSKRSLALAEDRFPSEARFVSFDGTNIPFPDGHFDVIFSACVFHHISHTEHLYILREWHRVLRQDGLAVIFEHNPLNPLTVRAVNTCPFDDNAVLITGKKLVLKMKDAGFKAPCCHYRIFFPGQLRALRVLEPFLRSLPLGAQYYVAAHKN